MPIAGNTIIDEGREAIYLQVARQVKTKLKEGNLPDNGRLPSYRTLAGEFGVSMGVIQRAMQVLRDESLVRIHHGKSGRAIPGKRFVPEMAKYGLIHPYTAGTGFGRALYALMAEGLERNHCDAMSIVRSSAGDPVCECNLAEAMVYNGVRGILLSPENSSTNAAYFEELSHRVPVMLIDQPLAGTELPAVIFDYADAGREIGTELRSRGCRRTVLLLNEKNNRSIDELAAAMAEKLEISFLKLPLFRAERLVEKGDYTLFDVNAAALRRELESGSADSLFCPFCLHLDYLFMGEMPEELRRRIVPATLCNTLPEIHSRTYCTSGILEWELSHLKLLTLATERLIKWCRSGRRPRGIRRIKLARMN